MGAKPAVSDVFSLRRAQQNARFDIGGIGKNFRSANRDLLLAGHNARRKLSRNSCAKVDDQRSRKGNQAANGEDFAEAPTRHFRLSCGGYRNLLEKWKRAAFKWIRIPRR